MGERTRRLDTLLGQCDGRSLDRANPNGKVALPVSLLEQDNRLVCRHLDSDADDLHMLHCGSVPRLVAFGGAHAEVRSAPFPTVHRRGMSASGAGGVSEAGPPLKLSAPRRDKPLF